MGSTQPTSPQKAIKAYCRTQCCCVSSDNAGSMEAWKNCQDKNCFLHPFRLGENPFRKKREMTDEARQAVAERLQKSRESKENK